MSPHNTWILCAKFDCNKPSGSGEEDLQISSMYFRYFAIISPWKGRTLHLKKFESSSPKDALCLVCLKLALWIWKRFFLISSMYFRYNVIISHWKREGSFIWTNLNPLHLRMRCAKLTTMPTKWQRLTTDKFRSEKFTWAFGSGELKKDVKELIGYSF